MVMSSNPSHKARLIVVQGSARGGKGTISHALFHELSRTGLTALIDQGLKFRVLAKLAIDSGVDIENLEKLAAFIGDPSTHTNMLELLRQAQQMTRDDVEEQYYTPQISNASGMTGKLPVTHDVVVSVLLDQIRELAKTHDYIVVDGRAMDKYARQLDQEGAVVFVLAIDVMCSPVTAAKRSLGYEPNATIHTLTSDQKTDMLQRIDEIDRRNSSDARRERDPSLPIHGAFEFDVLHEWLPAELEKAVNRIRVIKAVCVDNSYTRNKEQLTDPVITLVHRIIEDADQTEGVV